MTAARESEGRRPDDETLRRISKSLDGILSVRLSDNCQIYTPDRGCYWVRGLGVVAEVKLYDFDNGYRHSEAMVVAVPAEEVERWEALLSDLRTRAEVLAERGAGAMDELFEEGGLVRELGLRELGADEEVVLPPSDEDLARRRGALRTSLGRFEAAAEKMRQVYGLRLPRYLAVFYAALSSLEGIEERGLEALGRSLSGIMIWFEEGGCERPTRDGLDGRLESRFRCDPPEFVTIMHGDSDGLHYGLWYDDSAGLPTGIASNYARDSAETSLRPGTPLDQLRHELQDRITDPHGYYSGEDSASKLGWQALFWALTWFEEAERQAIEADGGLPPWPGEERDYILAGPAPLLPPQAGDPRTGYAPVDRRSQAYRERAPQVLDWIEEADAELEAGRPAFALTLGRELHWFDADEYREDSLRLMCAAYRMLGRDALAEIVEVHHEHRDLTSVAVYERA